MNTLTTTILLAFVAISTILFIVLFFLLIEATYELTNAINGKSSKGNGVKFIGLSGKVLPFGKSPKGRRRQKNWGIH